MKNRTMLSGCYDNVASCQDNESTSRCRHNVSGCYENVSISNEGHDDVKRVPSNGADGGNHSNDCDSNRLHSNDCAVMSFTSNDSSNGCHRNNDTDILRLHGNDSSNGCPRNHDIDILHLHSNDSDVKRLPVNNSESGNHDNVSNLNSNDNGGGSYRNDCDVDRKHNHSNGSEPDCDVGHRYSDGSHGGCHNNGLSSPIGHLDETEEWNKIESLMASLGTGLNIENGLRQEGAGGGLEEDYLEVGRESLEELCIREPLTEGASSLIDRATNSVQTVGEWLHGMGLSHYEENFISNGFDDLAFMGKDCLTDADLVEIGITHSEEDRKRILASLNHRLTSQPNQSLNDLTSIEGWLNSLSLSDYTQSFHSAGYTSLERVLNIWDVELTSVLRITRLGHRNRIIASIQRLRPNNSSLSSAAATYEKSMGSGPRSANNSLSRSSYWTYSGSRKRVELDELSLYKDYSSLSRSRGSGLGSRGQNLGEIDPSRLTIRPPRAGSIGGGEGRRGSLSSGGTNEEFGGEGVMEWKHPPELLLKSSCDYITLYLGSDAVQKLEDATVTQQTITSVKAKELTHDLPRIILSISYRGVKFLNANTKDVVGVHEIGNIFCVCQDCDSLNYFAFVTWDPERCMHFCHVFCVESTERATEVVLTLGEAFEVAYQLTLKNEKSNTEHNENNKSNNSKVEKSKNSMAENQQQLHNQSKYGPGENQQELQNQSKNSTWENRPYQQHSQSNRSKNSSGETKNSTTENTQQQLELQELHQQLTQQQEELTQQQLQLVQDQQRLLLKTAAGNISAGQSGAGKRTNRRSLLFSNAAGPSALHRK